MRNQRSGLTLVEITIVVLLLGIVAAVTMPKLTDAVQASQLRHAAIVMQSHLAHARTTAIRTGRDVRIDFDNSADRYSSSTVTFPERNGEWLDVDLREQFGLGLDLTVHFNQTSSLEFDLEGVPHVSGNRLNDSAIELRLGSRVQRIVLNSSTGLAVLASEVGS